MNTLPIDDNKISNKIDNLSVSDEQENNTQPKRAVVMTTSSKERNKIEQIPTFSKRMKAGYQRMKYKAQEKGAPVLDRLASLNELDGSDIAAETYRRVERGVGEVTGALSGVTRALAGVVLGAAPALVAGATKITPSQVARMRLKAGELEPIGEWTRAYKREGIAFMDIQVPGGTLDALLDENQRGAELVSVPLAQSTRTTLKVGDDRVTGALITLESTQDESVIGYLFAAEADGRTVYAWTA